MYKKLGSFILKLLTLLCFAAVSLSALFYAYGYQYDVHKQDVKKTSIIDLLGSISESKVFLSGKIVSNFLPYQIKGVEPGNYLLSVAKNGFRYWQRNIKVEADLVTIVNDILLVPDRIESYMKFIKDFDLKSNLDISGDLILAYEKGSNLIRSFSMYYDGSFRDDELLISAEGISDVIGLGNNRFMLESGGNELSLFSASERKSVAFSLPSKGYDFRMDDGGKNLFFKKDSDLYAFPFDNLTGQETKPDMSFYKVFSGVDNYVLGFDKIVYYVMDGGVYMTDFSFVSRQPLALSINKYKNISFKKGRNYGFLVTRDANDIRCLYLIDRSGKPIKMLSADLYGKAFFNAYDHLIFAENSGKIRFYDPLLKSGLLVTKMELPFDILGWFTDEGHYIVQSSGYVKLDDIYDANEYDLFHDDEVKKVFVFNKNLFFLKDNDRLFGLNWKNAI